MKIMSERKFREGAERLIECMSGKREPAVSSTPAPTDTRVGFQHDCNNCKNGAIVCKHELREGVKPSAIRQMPEHERNAAMEAGVRQARKIGLYDDFNSAPTDTKALNVDEAHDKICFPCCSSVARDKCGVPVILEAVRLGGIIHGRGDTIMVPPDGKVTL